MIDNFTLVMALFLSFILIFVWLIVKAYDKSKRYTDELQLNLHNNIELIAKIPLLEEIIDKQKIELQSLLDINDELKDENNHITIDNAKKDSQILYLNMNIVKLDNDLVLGKKEIFDLTQENIKNKELISKYRADWESQLVNNRRLKDDLDEQSKKLELKLEQIMNHTIESKIKKFDNYSMKELNTLLEPFKTNLNEFKRQVSQQQESGTAKFASLSKEIEYISKIGINIGEEAKNLAQALKGKKQMQGSWGEMILESVLEHSGLIKGKHFETQATYTDSEGKRKRPDVIVKLPQDRTVIIDSKVSLNDYMRYNAANSSSERDEAIKSMIKAFKNHIDTLSKKDYTEYKVGTLQHVFMFIPIESAFVLAVQNDTHLYEYALEKNIAVVNPSILIVSLKTIYLYWQSEQSSTLAIKLFEEAGSLYDKMYLFAQSFKEIGEQLQRVDNTYQIANKRLTEGNGNLLGKVENLKQLGARTKRDLKDRIEFQSIELDVNDIKEV